jgi:hypothetical protein
MLPQLMLFALVVGIGITALVVALLAQFTDPATAPWFAEPLIRAHGDRSFPNVGFLEYQ